MHWDLSVTLTAMKPINITRRVAKVAKLMYEQGMKNNTKRTAEIKMYRINPTFCT
jgi:type VI protein secretion system component Hcp